MTVWFYVPYPLQTLLTALMKKIKIWAIEKVKNTLYIVNFCQPLKRLFTLVLNISKQKSHPPKHAMRALYLPTACVVGIRV